MRTGLKIDARCREACVFAMRNDDNEHVPPLLEQSSSADIRKRILDLMNQQTNAALSQGFLVGFLFGITLGIILWRKI
jgi:hypothetical protein